MRMARAGRLRLRLLPAMHPWLLLRPRHRHALGLPRRLLPGGRSVRGLYQGLLLQQQFGVPPALPHRDLRHGAGGEHRGLGVPELPHGLVLRSRGHDGACALLPRLLRPIHQWPDSRLCPMSEGERLRVCVHHAHPLPIRNMVSYYLVNLACVTESRSARGAAA